jgi:superfamily I DNA and/or RNA helicase
MDAEAKTVWDREIQAKRIAEGLEASPLAAAASPAIRRKVAALKRVYQGASASRGPEEDVSRQMFDRSFESLLLRSANLVFASTNSADLARLIDERGQFDWSMIEEAGKATGVELLAPLMLSHRRLLIGDHQQLPAFEAKRLKDILAEHSKMRAALEAGRDVIAPLFRKLDIEDMLDWVAGNIEERICGEAISMLQLFETLIEPNVLKRDPNAPGRALGRQLLEQHRMHPVLGALISETFYGGKITTFPKATERFRTEAPPVASADSARLPDVPLVFVDLPYVQDTVGMKAPESKPRWTNRTEAAACVDVLSLLRAGAGPAPTLAVLSPYRRQVRLLRETAEKEAARLGHLDAFRAKTEDGFYGTVDSFQGNEADAVVVSLVRNNSRSGQAALGFLSDERRMNVLLSRAKWRLIVVGSVKFLRACLPEHDALPPGDPLAFLARMLNFIAPEEAELREGVKIIGIDTLRGAAK